MPKRSQSTASQPSGALPGGAKATRAADPGTQAEPEDRRADPAGAPDDPQTSIERLKVRAAALRELAGELSLTERRDRRRLSKVVHEHLQQILAAAKFNLSSLHTAEGDALRDGLSGVDELLAQAMAISRSLTAELSPPILYEAGLAAGLEWLSRRLERSDLLEVRLVVERGVPTAAEDVNEILYLAVSELLQNVVAHAGVRAARVKVAPAAGGGVEVAVADEGRGFDPARHTDDLRQGKLGLFKVRERIEQIGGKTAIRSAPGKGTQVTLTVPPRIGSPLPADGPPAPRRIRILLADDHAVMREGLARLLGQEPDMEVVGQAGDGQEAVEAAQQLRPDVVLMDISMPRLNGIEATRRIHACCPEIRVVGLSLYEADERAREMRAAGAVAYLTKSGPARELKAAVRAAAEQDRRMPPRSAAPAHGRSCQLPLFAR